MRFMLLQNYGEVGSGSAPITEWSPERTSTSNSVTITGCIRSAPICWSWPKTATLRSSSSVPRRPGLRARLPHDACCPARRKFGLMVRVAVERT